MLVGAEGAAGPVLSVESRCRVFLAKPGVLKGPSLCL